MRVRTFWFCVQIAEVMCKQSCFYSLALSLTVFQWGHANWLFCSNLAPMLLILCSSCLRPIDDEMIDVQYRPLCSPKLKNSFLTRDHDKLTILASCLHLLSFLAPNPPKKWQVIYGWPCFEMIMACYSLLFPLIYLLRRRMHESR